MAVASTFRHSYTPRRRIVEEFLRRAPYKLNGSVNMHESP